MFIHHPVVNVHFFPVAIARSAAVRLLSAIEDIFNVLAVDNVGSELNRSIKESCDKSQHADKST